MSARFGVHWHLNRPRASLGIGGHEASDYLGGCGGDVAAVRE